MAWLTTTELEAVAPPRSLERTVVYEALEAVWKVMEPQGYPRLTPLQRDYAERVLTQILAPGDELDSMVLEGPAGTGKTTLLVWIILALSWLERPPAVCAPTHKACSVLREKLGRWDEHFDVPEPVTVHSQLNLRLRRGKPGGPKEVYQSGAPKLDAYSVVIVDECSMVGSQLYDVILEACSGQVLVLFAGDPCQLQPVNEPGKSRTFSGEGRLVLIDVLRHDGAILDLATKIRLKGFVPVIRAAKGDRSEVRIHDSVAALTEDWLQTLQAEPESGNVVMLTYTNAARREFNNRARRALYGEDVPRFAPGDIVMALEPVIHADQIVYQNNEDLYIQKVDFVPDFEPIPDLGVTFEVWILDTGGPIPLYVLNDPEVDRHKKILEVLRKKISAEVKAAEGRKPQPDPFEVSEARSSWRKYYFPLEEFFAQVDYRYAMTIHKSQGSEWPTVYVNNDYTKARKEDVQLLYVAATRASRELNHVNNDPRRA